MFGEKSIIEKCDTELVPKDEYFKQKQNRCFFTGCINSDYFYDYEDAPVFRNRREVFLSIHSHLYNPGRLSHEAFVYEMRNSLFSVDLLGVGDPNKRTFEILMSGSLLISQYNHLLWPFDEGDSFSEETTFIPFDSKNGFLNVLNNLQNKDVYNKCLLNQYTLVKKYFNPLLDKIIHIYGGPKRATLYMVLFSSKRVPTFIGKWAISPIFQVKS